MPVQRNNPHRPISDATLEAAETLTRMRTGQLPAPAPAVPGAPPPQGSHPFRPSQWHTLPPEVIRLNPAYREAIRDMPVHDFLARHASMMRSGHGHQARAISEVAHSIPPAQFRNPGSQPGGSNPPPGFRDGILRHPLERQYPNFVDPGVAAARGSRTPLDHPMQRPIPAAIAWNTVPPAEIRTNPCFRESIRGMSVEAFLTHHQRLMNSGQPLHAHAMSHVAHSIPVDEFSNPGRPVRVDGPLIHPLMEPPAYRS